MKIALQKRTVGEKFNRTIMMMMMISITLNDYLIIYNHINKMNKFQQDLFKEYIDKLATAERKLLENLAERNQCLKTGRPTGRPDTVIRYEYLKAVEELKNLEKLVFMYERHPKEHTEITEKEMKKRIEQIQLLKPRVDKLITDCKQILGIDEEKILDVPQTTDYDIEGKDNKQLLQLHHRMLKDQDDKLDEVVGVVKVIRGENEDFKAENDLQIKMLTGLNQRVDKTQSKLVRVDERLKTMIAKQSKQFYYVVIAIEVAAIVLLIIL